MATITLFQSPAADMPDAMTHLKTSISDFVDDLKSLNDKVLQLDSGICDLSDVVESIQASTVIQKDKETAITAFEDDLEEFVDFVVARDKAVADDIVTWITEFYDEHPDLEPVSGFWKDLWRGIKDWCEDHILDEILLTIATIVGVVFGAITVASGWGGIVTVLVAILGISEGVAIAIATILAVIAVGSSVASAILNINDFWYKIDDEEFNKWQSGLALTAVVTNFIFSLPDIFKLFRLGATKLSAIFAKDVAKTAGDDIAKAVTNNLDEVGKLTDDVIEGGTDVLNNLKPQNLMDELASSGVKYNPDDVIAVTKTADGKLVWLENGTDTAGLNHIITEHADDFLNKGITQEQIPDYVMNALENGKIVGYQGRGTGRPIYEFTYNGEIHKVAITVGDNGFVVGANPK